jgi:DNA-directed RNA polymerase subunit RPC12/RpoP
MSWRPACPQCRDTVPFGSTLRRGRVFRCRRCGAPLIVAKPRLLVALAAFLLLILLLRGLRGVPHGWLLFALLSAVLVAADYLLVKPKLARDRQS